MDTKKLRQKILDLAIHGKLVPQDPNDEPASVLLERIRAEKERLIKEGKIKRSKKSVVNNATDSNDIPNGWVCCRFDELCTIFSTGPFGSMVHKSDYIDTNGIPLVNPANIVNGIIQTEKLMMVNSAKAEELSRYKLSVGDIILARRGDLSKCAIVTEREANWLCGTGSFVLHIPFALPRYIEIFYSSKYVQTILKNECVGATMDNINQGVLGQITFLLPPLDEQKRIVSAIEQWFTLIDILENAKDDLQTAIARTKSKILDLAIHGKLVPQDPNDEPAIELLKRINPKFVPCDNAHCPFDIPENWAWCKLGTISNYGKASNTNVEEIPINAWVLELEDIEKDTARIIKRITKEEREIKGVRHSFQKNDVLYSKLRTYLNKVLVAPENGYCTTEIVPMSFLTSIEPHYINHVLRSKYFLEYTIQCGYGVKMPRLSTTDACNGLVPLPPYQEQLRIVAKIEELFAVLDEIQKNIE